MDIENPVRYLSGTPIAHMLPFGAMLRPLLNDSCLSDADINNILRSRGVYVSDSDKKNIIPLMVTMILSPKEFEQLQEKQETKEDNPKHRNSVIKSKSKNSLALAIRDMSIDVNQLEKNNPDIHVNSPMAFSYVTDNIIQLEYTIVREDLTRDWVRPQSTHSGKVILTKNEIDDEISITNQYTSKETDDINRLLIKDVVSYLKASGEVDDTLKTICANDFTNRDRFNFMLQLAQNNEDLTLQFDEIKDIELGPDPDNPPKNPNSIFQQNVKKVIINGNSLERNSLLTDDEQKDNLLLRSIEAKYSFNCNGVKGYCTLQYGFMHFFRSQSTSQDFQVALLHLKSKSSNKNTLNSFVLNKFEYMKKKLYEIYDFKKSLTPINT